MHEPHRRRFQISSPLNAVKLEERPGSSLRNPTEILLVIPADAVVEIEGAVSRSGLVNVLWNGDAFSVFYEDLEKSTRPLNSRES
jgi:hypothetical protein